MNRWMLRYLKISDFFHGLKSFTKQVPASNWTPEFRELAEKIHTGGRDYFHVGLLTETGIIPLSDELQAMIADPKLFDPQPEDQHTTLCLEIQKIGKPCICSVQDKYNEGFQQGWKAAKTVPRGEEDTPLERAYQTVSRLLAYFRNCPLCGRAMPGHHAPDCEYLLIWDEVQKQRGAENTGEPICREEGCNHKNSSHFGCEIGSFCKECPTENHKWEHVFKP